MTQATSTDGTVVDALEPARSDAELISLVRGGDVDAYGDLFARHRDAATRLARSLVPGPDADDLVADAFAKVLNVLLGGGGPDVTFRPYLLTAVRRLHIDKIRATKRATPTDDLTPYDGGVPFSDTVIAGFEGGAAAQAFASLPERWQLVLWHLEVEGAKPADVAPLLGMTPNSVSALAYRAREGLRQAFLQKHTADLVEDDCRWTHDKLGAYVRKGLSRRDTTKVEEHLDGCRKCTAIFLELGELNSELAAVLGPIVLGSAAAAYLAATHAAAAGAGATGLVALLGRAKDTVSSNAPAAAATGVAVAAAAALAVMFLVPGGSQQPTAEHRPRTATPTAPPASSVPPSSPSSPSSPSAPSTSSSPGVGGPASTPSAPAAVVPAVAPAAGGANAPGAGPAPAPGPGPRADHSAPSAPSGLTFDLTARSVVARLAWHRSTDNVGVARYLVYVNGTRFAGTGGGHTTYTLTALRSDRHYRVWVVAQDAAGNRSARSNVVAFRTPAEPPPPAPRDTTPPTTPAPVVGNETQHSFEVSWPAADDNVGVAGYSVRVDGRTLQTTDTSLTITGLEPDRDYSVSVVARDAAGNTSQAGTTTGHTKPVPIAAVVLWSFQVNGSGNAATGTISLSGVSITTPVTVEVTIGSGKWRGTSGDCDLIDDRTATCKVTAGSLLDPLELPTQKTAASDVTVRSDDAVVKAVASLPLPGDPAR